MLEILKKIDSLPAEKRRALEEKLLKEGTKYGVYPLSFAQQRLWFLNQFEQNSAVYNLPSAFRFIGPLNIEALEKSIREIVKRHEILRTVFTVVDTKAFQVVLKDIPLTIESIDFQMLKSPEKEQRIYELVNSEARTPFNLKHAPLFRIKLVKLGPEEHVIIITMHHIISDGWSMGIFTREIAHLYDRFSKGLPPILPPLKIQYGDFAKWQVEYLQGEVLQKQIDYWKKCLGETPPPLDLPFDRPRPLHQTFSGRHISFQFSENISHTLTVLSRQTDTTMFMTLLGAFQSFLARYTQQELITVGTAIAGRNRPETENLIGFFVNTLVLQTEIDDNLSFIEILNRVKDITLGAYEHQDLPYEKLIDEIQPNRDLSAPPLFQVFFNYQTATSQKVELSNIKIETLKPESDTVKFDITLSFEERDGIITGAFGYNTDLFKEETIKRMIRHFTHFIENIIHHPDKPLYSISMIDDEEKNKILIDWNKTEKSYNRKETIHHLFERQVERTPNNIAVAMPDLNSDKPFANTLTYEQLNQQANRLAHFLIEKGSRQEDIIAVCLHRSPEMLISLLAILKSGGTYLPIEPNYPQDRIEYMLKDANVKLVITHSSLSDRFSQKNLDVICLDKDDIDFSVYPTVNPSLPICAESLAYIIYTSGSTGTPKGVMVQHNNLVNYIFYARELFQIRENDRMLQFASISFDAAGEEIYPTLTTGATLVLRNDTMISSVPVFLRAIEQMGISILDLPTAYWHQVVSEASQGELSLPESLRLVIIGGERAIPDHVWRWQQLYGKQVRLLNTYGPTESTVVATVWELPSENKTPSFEREVPIGRPVANARAYVLDRHLNPVPIGVVGELHIGGAGVTRGYLNRPDLTAQKFIANPFMPNDRLYKTGDLVRFLTDGSIEFLGRIDHQVKIRGFRIELGEIEAILRKHEQIQDVVLLAREDTPGDRRLVAYYVPKPNSQITAVDLRQYLKEHLPDYMLPSVFVKLDKLPYSATGKINYCALPRPENDRSSLAQKYLAPSTPVENFLARLWQDVLGVKQIGILDNFFDLGGDSLKAAILINRIQQELDEILYVVVLFDNPTIKQLATYLVKEYPQKIEKKFNIHIQAEKTTAKNADLNEEKIEQFRRLLARKTQDKEVEKTFLEAITQKLPRAIFILSAPRSGSTLLRTMLAGNPQLFSPPELALLNFRTMEERAGEFSGRDSGWMEGLYRAVMEIKQCDFDTSKKIIAEFEQKGYTTQQMYAELQSWLDGRIIVDKTTTYATNFDYLKRAEAYFDQPFYVHLTRRPQAMIQSYIDSNLDQVFGSDLPFTIREKAELFWIVNNSNIERLFNEVPEERRFFIRYEDLVRQPHKVMEELCKKLGIPFDEEMLYPYRGQKMRDGVHKESKMVGDPRFNTHKTIDPKLAEKWQTLPVGDALYKTTIQMAERYRYEILPEDRFPVFDYPIPVPRNFDLPLSFAQERLWFLDQLEPGNVTYNIPIAIRMRGKLDKNALETSLNKIIERHEILRTSIITVNGSPHLNISESFDLNIPIIDLTNLPGDEKERKIKNLVQEEALKPFDLSQIPLLRVKLLKLSKEEHIFLLTIHHIVWDGWSTSVLLNELVPLYNAFVRNTPVTLHPLPIQYADFAFWQRNWLKGENFERQINFWREQLKDATPYLELPTDYPRPAVQTFHGNRIHFEINSDLAQKLKDYSQKKGVTLFMILLAAYQTLLFRYSDQEDILVGTPIAGRNRKKLEPLIGFFVNTLVMRTDLSGNPTFDELVERVRTVTLNAFAHQDLPFEKLLDSLNIKRDVSRPPLFQTMFALQNIPNTKIEVEDLLLEQLTPENATAKFELTLEMAEKHTGELSGVVEYNTDLFEQTTIERMINHFTMLLKNIVQNVHIPISDLRLMEDNEAHRLLTEWNNKTLTFPANETIPSRFEQQAKKQPDVPAVVYQNRLLTYRELNQKANRLANYLLRHNIQRETIVGVLMDRSVDMVVAILGIMKAGAAYLPLDPSYPPERIEYMLTDAKVNYLCLQKSLIPLMNGKNIHLIPFDDTATFLPDESNQNPSVALNSQNIAYIIYTSGSTGKPKGVMIQHRSALNLAENLNKIVYEKLGNHPQRISLNAPIPFDASMQQIVMLTYGHTLYIIPQEVRADAALLLNFIRQNQLDVLDCVPSQLKLLLAEGLLNGQTAPKAILPGGEAIDEITWQTLANASNVDFYNMYGPTECTVDSTIFPIKEYPSRPTIGYAIANARFYVLDSRKNPVPIGVPGELHIAGEGVARGYLNKPELTAEKFIPEPFSENAGARMYASGDLVRWLPDGHLEFIGRVDHQVKVRGFRIELGEIEAVLREHEAINDVVVIARSDKSGDKRLVAYITGDNGKMPGISELRSFIKNKLPSYMIPSLFVKLDRFPLLPNGKVNRKALPEPDLSRPELETEFVEPSTEKEKILASIWKEVLGLDKIGVHDNFFELGGDSILSIQVVSRARQHGLEVTPLQIFQYQTISQLAAIVGEAKVIDAEQGLVTGEFPLTPIQHAFFNRTLKHRHHWNQSLMFELSQSVSKSQLQEITAALLRHHDALRLRAVQQNGSWHLTIAGMPDTLPVFYEVINESEPKYHKKVIETSATKHQDALSLGEGVLLRIVYYDLGKLPHRILIIIHHLAVDGVSWRILLEDLQQAFAQTLSGKPIQLPPKTTSYKRWAERLSEYARSEVPDQEKSFWLTMADKAEFSLVPDFPENKNIEKDTVTEIGQLNKEETEALLKDVPGVYKTEINDILLTALLRAYSRWEGRHSLLLNMEGHGRESLFEDIDVSRTVGWFTSLYPVHLTIKGTINEGDSIKSVKEQLRKIPRNGIGYGILRYLSPDSSIRNVLKVFDEAPITFNYLGQIDQTLGQHSIFKPARESKGPERRPDENRSSLLDITGIVAGGIFNISFSYSSKLFNRLRIKQLTNFFMEELRLLIKHCQETEKGGFTASDFALANLDDKKLDKVLSQLGKKKQKNKK